ncbi:MAG: glycoside hydrolase family 99-like domain-containing protein [Thermoguttaceae bacterium]|nr:glycoside hydrolase family 99-like domain-containing protein [Thermoguttaceae bacterium]MDW8078474.1 glycoside hydrolase family 99-like domain-containing protein [Thermoguttaceae bacterium]
MKSLAGPGRIRRTSPIFLRHRSATQQATRLVPIICAVATICWPGALLGEERILREWTFERAGDLEGWQPGGHLGATRVEAGTLCTTVTGSDPILVHEVFTLPLPATAFQVIEIRLFAPRTGLAEFFWTNTTKTQYGGFSPEKRTPFTIRPGWGVYRIRPFWQAEGQIIRLRLDLPPLEPADSSPEYRIDYIRIVELETPREFQPAEWDFRAGAVGWHLEGEGELRQISAGLEVSLQPGTRLVAPPIRLTAENAFFLSFEMAVDQPGTGHIFYATEKTNGLHACNFRLTPSAQPRVYNVPVGGQSTWRTPIVYLALEIDTERPAHLRLLWMKASSEPAGRPDLSIDFVSIRDALPRVGQVCEVIAQISNRGGETAQDCRAELILPDGVFLAAGSTLIKHLPAVDFYDPQRLSWKIFSRREGTVPLTLRISGPQELSATATETFSPPLNVPPSDYVPAPQPVRSEYEVGVYYFPGWGKPESWRPLEGFPERRPVLGYYQEGLPEVADWHIKWAVEHGITFFCYDWYWRQGQQQLTHALHDGYFKARYRDLIKFCLLWANHFGPGEHSWEDCEKVCQYWIENYFRRPEYFKVNGRPLLVIFSVYSLERDLGIDGTRQAIELWHRLTEAAGVGKLLVAGCGIPAQLEKIRQMGFDAITGYNWPSCGIEDRRWASFAEVAANYDRFWWRPLALAKALPVITPVSAGWDARPWHGDRALVLTDCTPQAFEKHLADAKQFVDETGQPKVILIEAWNEWGEGSYCEPHKQFGFGHLEAIRRVFCPQSRPPLQFGPQDLGRPLPEFASIDEPAGTTDWDFSAEAPPAHWSPMMNVGDVRIADGALRAVALADDPAFTFTTRIRAKDYAAIEVSLAVRATRTEDMLQIFWASPQIPYREEASVRLRIVPDGILRTYTLPVSEHALWRGLVTQLRLDPCTTKGAEIVVRRLRLVPVNEQNQGASTTSRPATTSREIVEKEQERRRDDALLRMQLVMGPLPGSDRRVPLEPKIVDEVKHEKYIRRKITYAVEPGDRVPAWLLIPLAAIDNPQRRFPAMLCLHQTVGIGKDEPAGLGGNPNLHYAKELAERGYVTLAPDYLGGDIPEVGIRGGFGEYRTDPYKLGYVSGSMKGIWNHMRAVDLLQSLPFVDPEKIGVIGHSLGGYNSLFVAAFDPRIKVVVSSCGFTSFPRYYGGNLTGWSHRGHMPRIATIYDKDPRKVPFDFPDVLAAIAPRPIFINAPTKDFFDIKGVVECVEAVQPIYQAFGVPELLVAAYPEGGHDFPPKIREEAYQFVDKVLRGR